MVANVNDTPTPGPRMRMLTKQETATVLRVSVRTVERLMRDRVLMGTRVRRQVRFSEAAVQRYIDRSTK